MVDYTEIIEQEKANFKKVIDDAMAYAFWAGTEGVPFIPKPTAICPDVNGKCPKDGRVRPVFISVRNERIVAMSDGFGNAFKVYGEGYDIFKSECKPENIYLPEEYEFLTGFSSFDF